MYEVERKKENEKYLLFRDVKKRDAESETAYVGSEEEKQWWKDIQMKRY